MAGVAWSPPDASHDDFLIKADKNSNTQGLRLQGLAPDGALDVLLAAAARGDLQALLLHRSDLTAWRAGARAVLERVPCLVVLDSDQRESVEFADAILPVATHAESDGTFTNHAGRVQRFRAAVAAPGEARPGWQALGELLALLSGEPAVETAEAAFAALAAECPPFRGLGYAALGGEGRPTAT